jgi:hypothetical protein
MRTVRKDFRELTRFEMIRVRPYPYDPHYPKSAKLYKGSDYVCWESGPCTCPRFDMTAEHPGGHDFGHDELDSVGWVPCTCGFYE